MRSFLNTTLRNIAWFKSAHESEILDMKPPFQRNPVWVTRQKSFLIDTILNGFPIPEIYMLEVVNETGNTKQIVVDGQQRIRTVLEFIEGEFSIDGKDSPDWGDLYFEDLTTEERKRIFEYNFVVRILPEMDDIELRSIFQRLNKNVVALNKQELRHATYWGPFIKQMNELSNKRQWPEFGVFSQNDVRRMLDVEFISELTVAIILGLQNKKANLEKCYSMYEEEYEHEDYVEEVFDTVLTEIRKTLPDLRTTRWRKKADFYTLFMFFVKKKENLPLSKSERAEVSTKIYDMGKEIDDYVKTSDEERMQEFNSNVRLYCQGIRATTDLTSRRRREEGLEKYLDWDE